MSTSKPSRDPLVILGLAVVTLAAAISSFGALYGAALIAGWTKTMAPLLPVTVDATALTATRIWLAAATPTQQARRFARATAFGSVVVSLLGNGTYHLAEAHLLHPGVWLVIAAGAVPPVALAVVSHLAVIRTAHAPMQPAEITIKSPEAQPEYTPTAPETPEPVLAAPLDEVPAPAPVPPAKPERALPGRPWGDLLHIAGLENQRALAETGKPAGINRLRRATGVGQVRAQRLRDELANTVPVANGHALIGE